KMSIGSRKPSIDIRNESCVTFVVYLSTPSAPDTFSNMRSAARAGYWAITSVTSSSPSTSMPSCRVSRRRCSRSSICASVTLPASSWATATEVSTSRKERLSSVRVVTTNSSSMTTPAMAAKRKILFLSMKGLVCLAFWGVRLGSALVDARVQRAHVGQVAVALGVVQAVADDELVGDVESDVRDVELRGQGVGLAQQGDDLERPRVAVAKVLHQPRQGEAGVDDVLEDHHVAALDVAVAVLEDADDAGGGGGVAVRRHRHELHLRGQIQPAGEVGHEEDGALEHADQDEVLVGVPVALVHAGGHFGDAGVQLLFADQDGLDILPVGVVRNVEVLDVMHAVVLSARARRRVRALVTAGRVPRIRWFRVECPATLPECHLFGPPPTCRPVGRRAAPPGPARCAP